MLRYLAPYLTASLAIAILTGIALGQDAISVPAMYGLLTLALLVTAVGGARWEQRDDRSRRQR